MCLSWSGGSDHRKTKWRRRDAGARRLHYEPSAKMRVRKLRLRQQQQQQQHRTISIFLTYSKDEKAKRCRCLRQDGNKNKWRRRRNDRRFHRGSSSPVLMPLESEKVRERLLRLNPLAGNNINIT
jgi:hypothetical protein